MKTATGHKLEQSVAGRELVHSGKTQDDPSNGGNQPKAPEKGGKC